MNSTRHAKARAQQRCIPPLIVEWLLAYGQREPSHGAVRVAFDKRSRRELARDIGQPVIKQVGRFLGISLVVDADTDRIITVMWRN
jgi:hypothetical protein